MEFPSEIKKHLIGKEYIENTIGQTDSKVFIFDNLVLKIQKISNESKNECEIMQKLNGVLLLPNLVEYVEKNGLAYTLMSKVKGEMLDNITNEDVLVTLLYEAFEIIWSVNINDYNIDKASNIQERLKVARYNVENSLVDINNVMPETFGPNGFKNPKELLEWLESNIPDQDLVFSHGDFCFENIFVCNSHISGFIDLGKSGVADRWQDLAICIRELDEKSGNKLLKMLGIKKDEFKLKYYMLLDELF